MLTFFFYNSDSIQKRICLCGSTLQSVSHQSTTKWLIPIKCLVHGTSFMMIAFYFASMFMVDRHEIYE